MRRSRPWRTSCRLSSKWAGPARTSRPGSVPSWPTSGGGEMTARSEREKMLAGEPYLATDPELRAARLRARQLCAAYNGSAPEPASQRLELLRELLAAVGPGVAVE